MKAQYMLVLGLNLLTTTLVLQIINYALPFFKECLCSCVSTFIAWVCISSIAFRFSKKKFLNEKVETKNRAVFITGCDSGFGNALARRLDSKGFHVFASCLFPDAEGASKLKASCSDRLQILHLDVRRNDSVEKAVECLKEKLGSSELWAVVNNAGILKGHSAELSTMDDFQDVMDVNYLGTVRVTKAFLPLLKKSKGRIVNVTSLGGEVTIPFITPYMASKYAAVGFADCLRLEVGRQGISVVTIEPEIFLTQLISPDNVEKNLYLRLDDSSSGEKALMDVFLSFACRDINVVVDDMESAVTLVYPDHTYKPRRHALARFLFFCYERMPRSFQIMLIKIVLFIFLSESELLRNIVVKVLSIFV